MSGTETNTTENTEVKTLANGSTEFVDTKTEVITSDGMTTETVTVSSTVIEAPTETPAEIVVETIPVIETPKNQDDEKWMTIQNQLTAQSAALQLMTETQAAILVQLGALQTLTAYPSASADAPAKTPEPQPLPLPENETKPAPEKQPKPEKKPPENRRRWL